VITVEPAVLLAVVLSAAFAALGAAKVAKTPAMVARAGHVGFSAERYQLIGVAELAGALGILLGLAFAPLGYAAAAGLVALMAGALLTHARQGDGPAEMAPALLFAAGGVAYLALLAATR
jgi:uncharacterized membrane protein YphA (DoxX/SURF4 family)